MNQLIDKICDSFESAWQGTERVSIESLLQQVDAAERDSLLYELLRLEISLRLSSGESPEHSEYDSRFPDKTQLVAEAFQSTQPATPNQLDLTATSDHGNEFTADSPPAANPPLPEFFGRYRVEELLGKGGFGAVYRAIDEQLKRAVAIKVTFKQFVAVGGEDAFLAEARTVASLDHPRIVPVYDVGQSAEGDYFVVSKLIDGRDLAHLLASERPSRVTAIEIVSAIADALHYAHTRGLVHRDVKPANILIDQQGDAYLADFGIALREQDLGQGAGYVGTPAYMSPEQARGEGHRVDGRSDIYGLGVVIYETLTGRRPFEATDSSKLLEQISRSEVRPPRQLDDTIPSELERICLKSLALRASDRYSTARDLADDLQAFSASLTTLADRTSQSVKSGTAVQSPATPTPTGPTKIVPKGLRSFDKDDADFFLELLPGPCDRTGLPESLRFWKRQIEAGSDDDVFNIGLIYGPSGCGKSSLMKAGLLPRLSADVIPVYIEATSDVTESSLARGIQKKLPALPGTRGLKELLTAVRRGQGLPSGKKLLLVIDQFEQWLHGRDDYQTAELAAALRQCDGAQVQCVLMVRDDFWLPVSRFMRELEVPLLQGQNSALVDLFALDHARRVLGLFGRAYGKLPDSTRDWSDDQTAFIEQAVAGLAQDRKVISVHLALFAEMVKSRDWTTATLREVGGARGIGKTFLEETFSASIAPKQHRVHEQAARAVLAALLPEQGSDIKGHKRSRADLLAASGYQNRPADFEELRRILDSELRLITPAETESDDPSVSRLGVSPGSVADSDSNTTQPGLAPKRLISPDRNQNSYQLTHDFLVPSLREWLTQKQQETRTGRAELLLAERSAQWQAKSESRYLPSLIEWTRIRAFTDGKKWTPGQRTMMSRANRVHGARLAAAMTAAVLLVCTGLWIRSRVQESQMQTNASGRVAALLSAETVDVPKLVDGLPPYRRWANAELADALTSSDPKQQLHARIALLPVDTSHVHSLKDSLLDATPANVLVLRSVLEPAKADIAEEYWQLLQANETKPSQRLAAAAALAKFSPDDKRWSEVAAKITKLLVDENPLRLTTWIEAFQPVRAAIVPELGVIFRDQSEVVSQSQRDLATNILETYAADNVDELAELILDAQPKQFVALFDEFAAHGSKARDLMMVAFSKRYVPASATGLLSKELAQLPTVLPRQPKPLSEEENEKSKETLAIRSANAVIALVGMGNTEQLWPILKASNDPRLRTWVIHRLSSCGIPADVISQRLPQETDPGIRRALILTLGEYKQKLEFDRKSISGELLELYQHDPDAGVHAAAEWVLREWKYVDEIISLNSILAAKQRPDMFSKSLSGSDRVFELASASGNTAHGQSLVDTKQWYMTKTNHHTMVILPGPVSYFMGSPETEIGRESNEVQYRASIDYPFAISAKETTLSQFKQAAKELGYSDSAFDGYAQYTVNDESPFGGTFYEACAYCNWLSKQDEIPVEQWCYEPNDEGKFGSGMKIKPRFHELTGYRLPTQLEWEYAARANTTTSRYYGQTDELLPRYAWFLMNSDDKTWPVASLKPNDFGLFDTLGNVGEWCNEKFWEDPSQSETDWVAFFEGGQVESSPTRVLKGESIESHAHRVRLARKRWDRSPDFHHANLGFRIVRTVTEDAAVQR